MSQGLVLVAGGVFKVSQKVLVPVVAQVRAATARRSHSIARRIPFLAQGQEAPLKARQRRLFHAESCGLVFNRGRARGRECQSRLGAG